MEDIFVLKDGGRRAPHIGAPRLGQSEQDVPGAFAEQPGLVDPLDRKSVV